MKLTEVERDILLQVEEAGGDDLASIIINILADHSPAGMLMPLVEAGQVIVNLVTSGLCVIKRDRLDDGISQSLETSSADLLASICNGVRVYGETPEDVRVADVAPAMRVLITELGLRCVAQ